ncbi:MAG: hypothetical protein ABEH38_07635, partial [Flavobacteriales bacterium]
MMNRFTHLLFVMAFLLPISGMGQSPAGNLDFEAWTSSALGPHPAGYAYADSAAENTMDPQNGSSALSLVTWTQNLTPLLPDTIGRCVGSGAYTKRPDSLSFYFRYQLPNQDTAAVLLSLTDYNPTLDTTVTVSRVTLLFPNVAFPMDTISNWTKLQLPMSYDTCLTPDSIRMSFWSQTKSAFGIGSRTLGGNLEIDNMELQADPPVITNIKKSNV